MDVVEKSKVLPVPGLEFRPSSPYLVAILNSDMFGNNLKINYHPYGRAIAQAVSLRLPTAAARVQTWV
jgi:hypothetical protein